MAPQTGSEIQGEYPEYYLGTGRENIFYAAYERTGVHKFHSFKGFVREEATNYLKERLDYRIFKIELPRTISSKDLSLEVTIRENPQIPQMEGRGERPTSPRPSPYDLEKNMPKPDLKDLKLDVLEGVVY